MRFIRLQLVVILLCLISLNAAQAKRRPFIRGVFLVRNTECYLQDSTAQNCCPGTHWPDERGFLYNADNPRERLHANHITGWEWPERTWMDSVCNASNGMVKKWGGDIQQNANTAWNWQSQSWRDNVIDDAVDAYADWGQDIGLFGYFIGHEIHPTPGHTISEYYPGFNYMCWVSDSVDSNPNRYTSMIMTSGMITPGFSDSVTHLDYVESEFYPYRGDTPVYGGATPPAGAVFQARIDAGVDEMNNMMNWFKDDSVSWIVNIQSSGWHSGYGSGEDIQGYCDLQDREYKMNASQPITVDWRFPSREEMRLTAFIGISRGAKGIRAFTYGTTFDYNSIFWGLLHFRNRVIFHPTDPAYQEDTLTNYYPAAFRYNYAHLSDPPFYHIAELYADLEPHEVLLTNLYVTAAGSYRQNRDSTVTFIKGVRSSDSASVVPPGY